MTPGARQHLLDMLGNGAPDCALAELISRAHTAGQSATPVDIDVRGMSARRARRILQRMVRRAVASLERDAAALFG